MEPTVELIVLTSTAGNLDGDGEGIVFFVQPLEIATLNGVTSRKHYTRSGSSRWGNMNDG